MKVDGKEFHNPITQEIQEMTDDKYEDAVEFNDPVFGGKGGTCSRCRWQMLELVQAELWGGRLKSKL